MRVGFGRALVGLTLLAAPVAVASEAAVVQAGAAVAPPGLATVERAPLAPLGARALGPVSASASVGGEVVLQPRDEGALVRFIAAVSNKASADYGRYLPRGAFASHFGPRPPTIAAVRAVLGHEGLDVTGVSSDGLLVGFKGTAATVERAFHTGLERYRLADGTSGTAATGAIRVPSGIAHSVAAVVGLDNLVRPEPIGLIRASAAEKAHIRPATTTRLVHPRGAPAACAGAKAAAASWGGLTDDAIANSYGAFGLYGSGDVAAGQHIALYELEPFARSDIKTFDTCYFGATAAKAMLSRLKVIPIEGGQPAGSGSGEALLDVEDLSALAPGASIDVYEAPSYGTNGLDYDPVDNYAFIVDSDTDQVVSTSWGLCEQAIQAGQPGLQQAENLLFEQAAAQGQSIFSAAGDNGSDDCNTGETTSPIAGQNPVSVDDPSSQPYVTSVGGTSIDAATQPPVEQVWNDGAAGGAGGGGISESWTMPAWQRAATVPGIARPGSSDYTAAAEVEKSFGYATGFCQDTVTGATASTPCRLVPDVSAQADEFTGAITVYQAAYGGWGTTGGTSSATPIWAALTALTNASPTCLGNAATKHGVGFVSPQLYAVASNPAEYKASFNDVTQGNNDVYALDDGAVFKAGPGYDLASGLGSPRLTGPGGTAGLAYYLCRSAASAARPVVSNLSPSIGSTAGATVAITGKGFEVGGKADVSSIQVGTAQLSSADFTVHSATSITAQLPPAVNTLPPDAPAPQDGAGAANVIVTLAGGLSSMPGPPSRFEYVDTHDASALPSITGVVAVAGSESAPAAVKILGSGFTGATGVSFGGVAAASYSVRSQYEITAVPPAYSPSIQCAALPTTGEYAGDTATNDICQVQVSVENVHGPSAEGTILPPDEGPVSVDSLGALVPPAGCGCETQPAPTEYDYVPTPHVTSVSTSGGAADLASERGTTVITIHGRGLDPMTIDWANIGSSTVETSQDISYVFSTGTELQIVAPGEPRTTGTASLPLSVRTIAGLSSASSVTYAGVPKVTGVVTTHDTRTWHGRSGAADTGGTAIEVKGEGFAGEMVGPVEFKDAISPYNFGTQYAYSVVSNGEVTTETVGQNPGIVDVELCTVSGCSRNRPADELYVYPPGTSSVTSVSPGSGPVAGGTKVTIGGHNLGCALAVSFGTAAAKSFSQPPTALDCGNTSTVDAVSPAGNAGSAVTVTVMTAAGYFSGTGKGKSSATFTYTKA